MLFGCSWLRTSVSLYCVDKGQLLLPGTFEAASGHQSPKKPPPPSPQNPPPSVSIILLIM